MNPTFHIPGFTQVTPSPTLSTIPAPSWPGITGYSTLGKEPVRTCSSVPHIPVAIIWKKRKTLGQPHKWSATCALVLVKGCSEPVVTQTILWNQERIITYGEGPWLSGKAHVLHAEDPRVNAWPIQSRDLKQILRKIFLCPRLAASQSRPYGDRQTNGLKDSFVYNMEGRRKGMYNAVHHLSSPWG